MAENETQEKKEEVTEAVETQSPATEKGVAEEGPAAEAQAENEAKTDEQSGTEATTAADDKAGTEAKTDEQSGAEEAAAEEPQEEEEEEEEEEDEEISYHAVEKEGEITAIWEMQGRKHLRTISPRSTEGEKILNLFTSELHETDSPPLAASNE